MVRIETHSDQQADDCHTGSACAAGNHTDIVGYPCPVSFRCVEHRCQRNDGRAVLVIVENRNVAAFLQAVRSISKQRGAEMSSRFTPPKLPAMRRTVFTISSTSLERTQSGIASTLPKRLEQCALAFHNRHTSLRADIAQTQNSSTVGDNSDQVAPAGQVIALGKHLSEFPGRAVQRRAYTPEKDRRRFPAAHEV